MTEITVGLEVEVFDDPRDEVAVSGTGEITADAAPDLIELVGLPGSKDQAVARVRELARHLSPRASFSHIRPAERIAGADVWRENARYDALKQALALECPDTWQGVNLMTHRAATHCNWGIDWATPAGVAWLSLMNNIAPIVAAKQHERHGIPCDGLLAPWEWGGLTSDGSLTRGGGGIRSMTWCHTLLAFRG